ncbi:MAG: carbohydrate ABC transporter permease [Microbacteriaceae bacterium]|nr:MAG: carbohydrate ABC transporter permease [Microbacteriaceae bacterium]
MCGSTTTRRPAPTRVMSRLVLHLALAAYCLGSVGAFMWYLMTSLKTNTEFFSESPWALPADPQWGNYLDAWNSGIGGFFFNSLYVTVLSVTIGLFISLMASYALARIPFRGSQALLILFVVGMMLPAFGALIPLYLLLRDIGLLGTLNGLVVVYIAVQIPLNVFLLRGFMVSMPRELEEAAYVDGASPFRTFVSVIIPQSMPMVVSLAVLNTLNIWNEFVLALVLLPRSESYTVPIGLLGLAIQAEYSAQWVQLFAGLILTSIPMLVLFAIAQERIARGLTFGGMKG